MIDNLVVFLSIIDLLGPTTVIVEMRFMSRAVGVTSTVSHRFLFNPPTHARRICVVLLMANIV